MTELPQTDFTRKIEVTAYDAKMFIAKIESQLSMCETLNLPDAKYWRAISRDAHLLFGIPYVGYHLNP